ncbi:MAG: hypothetical protein D6706_08890 [Chloroflexi bacterium]|nr:MAG: hypothetical protein D6706_08890 [Chloroflexota bacterium]
MSQPTEPLATRYALLKTAVLALADQIDTTYRRYIALPKHDPHLAQVYFTAADELRRLVTAVEAQSLPCLPGQAHELAHKAHMQAMIAADQIQDSLDPNNSAPETDV